MKKIITILTLSSFLLVSCWKTEEVAETKETVKYVKTETVKKKNFSENLKFVWKVDSSKVTSISPLTSWTIKTISVKVWDKVKTWDILATIDTESNLSSITLNNASNVYSNTLNVYNSTKETLQKNLESSRLQYENAVTTRNNTYTSNENQLSLAKAQLESITTQKNNTTNTSKTSISLANESLENAKLNLDNFNKTSDSTLKSLDTKKNSLINNIRVSIDTSIASMDSLLTFIDEILWVTELNKYKNDTYEMYLSAKNTSLKTESETSFKESNYKYIDLKSKYNQNLSSEQVLNYYTEVLSLSEKLVTLSDKIVWVLDNSIASSTFTDSTLNSYKASIKTYQANIIWLKSTLVAYKNSLNDIYDTIDSTKTSISTQKSSLEKAINIAKVNLENTKSSTNTSIDSLSSSENTTKIQLETTIQSIKSSRDSVDNSVKIAKANYEAAISNYNSSLAWTKSQLDNAAWSRNSSSQQFDNAIIRAPFDWIITEKNIEIWTSVWNSTKAFSISNNENKIVKLEINSDNIKYLNYWKDVELSKNWKTASWIITLLWASANETTKMFDIEISFSDKTFSDSIILWDFVDVYINKSIWEEKFIIIPFSSLIVWSNDSYSVYVIWKNNLVEEKIVTIWSSNSKEIIILTWLKEWDKVIKEWALNVSIWDKVEEN